MSDAEDLKRKVFEVDVHERVLARRPAGSQPPRSYDRLQIRWDKVDNRAMVWLGWVPLVDTGWHHIPPHDPHPRWDVDFKQPVMVAPLVELLNDGFDNPAEIRFWWRFEHIDDNSDFSWAVSGNEHVHIPADEVGQIPGATSGCVHQIRLRGRIEEALKKHLEEKGLAHEDYLEARLVGLRDLVRPELVE